MKRLWQRLLRAFSQRPADQDYSEEIQSHIDLLAGLHQDAGLPEEAARQLARRQFGNPTRIQEQVRGIHLNPFLEYLAQDLRFALRSLRRQPVFSCTAIAAIALGMGASTAVFSVVDRILFRDLPYAHQDKLVSFGLTAPIQQGEFMLGPDYVEWRASQKPFEAVTSWSGVNDCDLNDTNPVRLLCARVESTFLPTFGINPVLGRNFTPEEDLPNGPRVALLSHALWHSRFHANPAIAGKSIIIDGQSLLITGVLPADFELPSLDRADILLPQALNMSTARGPGMVVLWAFARLKPGVTAPQAEKALGSLFQRSLQFVPAGFRKEVFLRVRTLRDRQFQHARTASWVLLCAVIAVLLIGCANVASLMLARALSRDRELAVRAALGGGRWRLIRQTLTESLVLSCAAGLAGCLLAAALLRWFVRIAPEGIPRLQQATLDLRVLAFAFLLSIACGLLFGLAAALRNPRPASLTGSRGTWKPHSFLHAGLVTGQIAASIVLLTAAGLLIGALWSLQNRQPGIQPETVLLAPLTLPQQTTPAVRHAFFRQLETNLARLPGLTTLALSDSVPPTGPARDMIYSLIQVEGRPSAPQGTGGMVTWRTVTPAYFPALGIRILQGRGFLDQDRMPGPPSMILSQALARRLFPTGGAVGAKIRMGGGGDWHEVIGVAADVMNNSEYYVARRLLPAPETQRRATFIFRTPLDQTAMAAAIRTEIAHLDPLLPVTVEPMTRRLAELTARPKFNAVLLGLFAWMGLLLAAVGIYGVLSFLVAQRRREIGVRMALGATSSSITRLVLGQAMRWIAAGTLLGCAGAYAASRYLQTLLLDVPGRSMLSLAIAVAILIAFGLTAAWIPGRRAALVDPATTLRFD
ncbi:MAG: ABC transporter permease [Acidobacteriia bacterium]|nr:ABC transporter permease [Terriglobia bacterium]